MFHTQPKFCIKSDIDHSQVLLLFWYLFLGCPIISLSKEVYSFEVKFSEFKDQNSHFGLYKDFALRQGPICEHCPVRTQLDTKLTPKNRHDLIRIRSL